MPLLGDACLRQPGKLIKLNLMKSQIFRIFNFFIFSDDQVWYINNVVIDVEMCKNTNFEMCNIPSLLRPVSPTQSSHPPFH